MIRAVVYRLESADMPHDVAHLFEHVVINALFELFADNGFAPGTVGWIEGVTFKECVYLDLGLYDDKAVQLCDDFIANMPAFSDELIERNRAIITCEERADIQVIDPPALRHQIDILQQRAWTNGLVSSNHATLANQKETLAIKKHAAGFRDITFTLFHDTFTLEEAKLFQRFSVMLNDTLHRAVYRSKACYYRASSDTTSYNDTNGMTFSLTLTVPRGQATTSQYTAFVVEALEALGAPAAYPGIRKHFEVIASTTTYAGLAVDYFRSSGVSTTTAELLELATPERVKAIIDKLYLECSPTGPDDPGYSKK